MAGGLSGPDDGGWPVVGVVVVSWKVRELVRACLKSLAATAPPLRVVVVDNDSGDGTVEMIRSEFPAFRVLACQENLGFPTANNLGLSLLGVLPVTGARATATAAKGPPPAFVLLLNPDAELEPGALEGLLDYLQARPTVAAVGPLLVNPDGSEQSSRRRFPSLLTGLLESTPLAWHWPDNPWARRYALADQPPTQAGRVDWVTGAAILLRSAALTAVGGFDAGYFMYSEELDLCRRLAKGGWEVHFTPAARVLHHEGQSSGQVVAARHRHFHRSRVRYFRRHHGRAAAELLRWGLLAQFAAEWALEAAKAGLGHKRGLRRQRLAAYWALLRDGLA